MSKTHSLASQINDDQHWWRCNSCDHDPMHGGQAEVWACVSRAPEARATMRAHARGRTCVTDNDVLEEVLVRQRLCRRRGSRRCSSTTRHRRSIELELTRVADRVREPGGVCAVLCACVLVWRHLEQPPQIHSRGAARIMPQKYEQPRRRANDRSQPRHDDRTRET